jgi:hypothetical protein
MKALAAPLKASGIEVETVVVVGLVLDDILEPAENIIPITLSWAHMGTSRRNILSLETSSSEF